MSASSTIRDQRIYDAVIEVSTGVGSSQVARLNAIRVLAGWARPELEIPPPDVLMSTGLQRSSRFHQTRLDGPLPLAADFGMRVKTHLESLARTDPDSTVRRIAHEVRQRLL